ncbi:homoserine dehydrogenase [Melghiribacillus thermohalophilus]|uniref:Homoserine dehydrogenase n=2 Tax=Melghiribacillus thermohalophilus TaxID=1324956 RepID=A0A4R3MXS3_9BACI|nr:homoserine dehydrogenase [Melghiribacillus thermohalophilus]
MQRMKIGLCGLGTVGAGVVKILQNHQKELHHQTGCELEIMKILVNDIHKKRNVQVDPDLLTTSSDDIVENEEIQIVIEVMGGIDEAYHLVKRSLENGKHVVTANKDMLAEYGLELTELAREKGLDMFYEASVAGGIPILRSLKEGLVSDRLHKLMGIVNGTTNYILTKMDEDERGFEDVLAEAQELGYAEADPSSDVDGLDAARKIALLARLAFSMPVELDDVEVRGIRKISTEDMKLADQFGYKMKLIGLAARDEDKVEVSVEPVLLKKDHPLTSVKNEYNAVYVYGDAVGETMFYGPGAGSLPTAVAVVSDLVGVVKNMVLGVNGTSYVIPQYAKQLKAKEEIYSKFFFRMEAEDVAGTFLEITKIFTSAEISLDKILQLPKKKKQTAEIVIVTHLANKAQFEQVVENLNQLPIVHQLKSIYRVEEQA